MQYRQYPKSACGKWSWRIGIPLVALAWTTHAAAQEEADGRWHGSVSVGGTASSGTTSNRNVTATADAMRATFIDKITLTGIVNNGTSSTNGTTTKTADLWRTAGRYDYNLTERVFSFGGGEAEANALQDLDYRWGANGGVGYKIINSQTATFNVFSGLGYSRAQYGATGLRQGVEVTIGEESTHTLSPSTNLKQRFAYFTGAHALGQRATFDSQIATSIIGAWTMNLGLSARYSSIVPAGARKTESLLTVGFGYKY